MANILGAKTFINFLKKSERCSNLRPNTLSTYGYSLNWMATRIDGFEYDGTHITVPKPETVIDYMDSNKVSQSRRTSSYTALKVWHNCRGETTESTAYGPSLICSKRCIDAEYNKQQRNPKQEKNWVEYACLKKYGATMRAKVFALDKNKMWSKNEVSDAQIAFFVTYHLSFPIRRDLATLQWGIKVQEDEKRNYVDLKTRDAIYNQHKTVKWYGQIKHQLNRPMWRLVSLLIKQQKKRKLGTNFIMVNRHWRKFTGSGFSNFLSRELKKMPGCEHKSVGCTSLRHSVITHHNRNDKTIAQKTEWARRCMHSTKLNDQYRLNQPEKSKVD